MTTELEALALGADALDGEVLAGEPGALVAQAEAAQQVDKGVNNVQKVALMLALAVPLLGKLYPSIAEIYTDQVQSQVAQSLGPVLSKYGVDLADMATAYGPEIAALVVCVPLAIATVAGVKADIQERMKVAPESVPKGVVNTLRSRPDDPVVLG